MGKLIAGLIGAVAGAGLYRFYASKVIADISAAKASVENDLAALKTKAASDIAALKAKV